jgi:hypothetical protein
MIGGSGDLEIWKSVIDREAIHQGGTENAQLPGLLRSPESRGIADIARDWETSVITKSLPRRHGDSVAPSPARQRLR